MMADFTPSIIVDDIFEAMVTFLSPIVGNAPVVRGNNNRVPLPDAPCVVITEVTQADLEVPYAIYDDTNIKDVMHGPKRFDIQCDFYGNEAGDFCSMAKTAFRSAYGFNAFPDGIKPLYTNDGMQNPLTTGEQQYENRWMLTVSLQYNPTFTVPQVSADTITLNPITGADI